jgi:hypothetical protein
MVTFHPSAKKIRTAHGTRFAPMVMVRNAAGQCVGSGIARGYEYVLKEAARNHARYEAHRTVDRCPVPCRVA